MPRTVLPFLAIGSLVALAAPACGSSNTAAPLTNGADDAGPGTDDAASDAATATVDAPVDAGPDVDNGSPSTNYPAPHPPLPTLTNAAGGPVLTQPKIALVFYPGYTYQHDLETLAGSVGATSYWSAATSEYGVGPLSFTQSYVLSDEAGAAPTTISDTQIDAFMNAQIAAGTFGTPDPSTIYTIVYPQSTTITMQNGPLGSASSCTSFGGYHSDTTVNGKNYAYAVIPTCASFGTLQGIDGVTGATSHEWIEAVTDPYPSTNNGQDSAYSGVDNDHFVWEITGGGEAGDLCVPESDAFFKPMGFAYTVQRTWSNKLAMASHDPCAPDLPNTPFFDSAPVLPETVTFSSQFTGSVTTKGVTIPVGKSKTIEIDLFSDAATSGPWKVDAFDALQALYKQPASMSFQWEGMRQSGVNGEKLHLTITVQKASAFGGAHPFILVSTLGQTQNVWPALVVE